VDKNIDVLEIGCSTGYMTKYLKENMGCRVVCVEIDARAAEKAMPYCEDMVVGDIESILSDHQLGEKRFDVILMADVMEHLTDPDFLLSSLKAYLNDSGYLLISVPNAAHGAVALELLQGKWQYRDHGLLDRTHLQFFDKPELMMLFDATGYLVSRLDRIFIHPGDTELKTVWKDYPREITAYLEKVNPEYQTYQYIIKAYPATETGWKTAAEDAVAGEKAHIRIFD